MRNKSNESIVNAIQFAYLKEVDIELSDIQREALLSVANQCPRTGGRFIYRARLLYNLLVENRKFDDTRCFTNLEEKIERRTEETKFTSLPEIQLYPNPAFNKVFIGSEENLGNSSIKIQFIDFTGRVLISQTFSNGNKEIDISNLRSGIYFCVVSIDKQRSQVQKIVVIK